MKSPPPWPAWKSAWKGVEAAAKQVEKKMKAQKDAFAADAKAYADNLKALKDMIAADPIGAKAKLGEFKAVTDKWGAAIQELAAPPAKADAKKVKS